MLTDATLAYLSTLTCRADARIGVCLLPLAGICWTDEMPQMHNIPKADEEQIYLLFMIRSKVWDELQLSGKEMELWQQVQSEAPEWAFFKRLKLSSQEQQVRRRTEQNCNEVLDDLFASADYVTIKRDENGVERRSATIRLDAEPKSVAQSPWWKVIARRFNRWRLSKRV